MRQTKSLPPPTDSALVSGPLQVAVSPCWEMALPDIVSALQSLRRCLDPYPAVSSWCPCSLLPRRQRPHPDSNEFGPPNYPCDATSTGKLFSRLQSFANVQAPTLASPQGCTHRRRAASPGRPGRLHHASPGWLPAPGCGIATCPTRATDTAGLSPAGLQPCRLLLESATCLQGNTAVRAVGALEVEGSEQQTLSPCSGRSSSS
jgi:hypothetical protein